MSGLSHETASSLSLFFLFSRRELTASPDSRLRLRWPWPISGLRRRIFLLVESDIKLLNSEERLEEELGAKKWEFFRQKNHNSDKRSRIKILQGSVRSGSTKSILILEAAE